MVIELRQTGIERWFFVPVFAMYVFVVQFGNYFRLSDAEVVPGLSTALGITLITVGSLRVAKALTTDSVFLLFFFLILWIAMASTFSLSGPLPALKLLANFSGYVMLAAVASKTRFSTKSLKLIWLSAAAGMAISSGLTVIDYVGIYNVPRNNDVVLLSRIGTQEVEQATGFFPRRSAMAAVFSTVIAGSILVGMAEKRLRTRLYFFGCGGAGALCVLLTHNRSAILASLIALSFYVLFLTPGGASQRIRIAMFGAIGSILLILIMWNYFPEHLDVYHAKLSHLMPGSSDASTQRNVAESDYGRVRLFFAALSSLSEYPAGHGFGMVKLPRYGFKGAHNVITSFLWAAGAMFIFWLPLFAAVVIRKVNSVKTGSFGSGAFAYIEATKCGLIAFALNNMVHDSWGTGLAWILFGVLLSFCGKRTSANSSGPSGEVKDVRSMLAKYP